MNVGRKAANINCDNKFTKGKIFKPAGKIWLRLGTKFEFIKKINPREITSSIADSCSSSHENFSFQWNSKLYRSVCKTVVVPYPEPPASIVHTALTVHFATTPKFTCKSPKWPTPLGFAVKIFYLKLVSLCMLHDFSIILTNFILE